MEPFACKWLPSPLRRSRTASERDMLMSLITGSGRIIHGDVFSLSFPPRSREHLRSLLVGTSRLCSRPRSRPESPFTSDCTCTVTSFNTGCAGLFDIHGLLREKMRFTRIMSVNYIGRERRNISDKHKIIGWKTRFGIFSRLQNRIFNEGNSNHAIFRLNVYYYIINNSLHRALSIK